VCYIRLPYVGVVAVAVAVAVVSHPPTLGRDGGREVTVGGHGRYSQVLQPTCHPYPPAEARLTHDDDGGGAGGWERWPDWVVGGWQNAWEEREW
jgi:hypothetical protein